MKLGIIADQANLLLRYERLSREQARMATVDPLTGAATRRKLMDRLDESTLEVLVYRYWDDLDQTEIAEVMGVSRKTVVRRMAVLRKELVRIGVMTEATRAREEARDHA